MKKILLLRTNRVDPDPRVEKEVSTLIKNKDYVVEIHAWDRDGKYKCRKEKLKLSNGSSVDIYRVGIPGNWGKGMKKNILPALKYELSLYRWLKKNIKNYDVVHACDLMTGYPALAPAKKYGIKMVYDCVDYYADSQHGPNFIINKLRRMETKVINKSEATILCSEKRIEQIKPANPKKVIYVHNSPNIDNFKIKKGKRICKTDNNKIKFVYVGNFCEDRWLIPFLENISKIENVEAHIGGFGGLNEKIEELASKSSNIFTYGKLKYNDVLKLESECDCLIAFYETNIRNHIYAAPNKFYEALAIGKPLIMLKGSGMSEIVESEKIGAVIEPNLKSLKEGINIIETLLKNRLQLKKKMNKLFNEKYSWKIMEERLLNLYSEVLGDSDEKK